MVSAVLNVTKHRTETHAHRNFDFFGIGDFMSFPSINIDMVVFADIAPIFIRETEVTYRISDGTRENIAYFSSQPLTINANLLISP
jgi:hypothetical protein